MCTSNGHGGGHVTPTSRGMAGRGHIRGSFGGARQNMNRTRLLDRLLGHMAADVLRRRATLRDWWAFETDLDRHEPGCRYRALCGLLRIGGTRRADTGVTRSTGQMSGQSGALSAIPATGGT